MLAQPAGSVVAIVQAGGISGPKLFANGEEIERAARVATLQLNLQRFAITLDHVAS
jgi:hypothetical protein